MIGVDVAAPRDPRLDILWPCLAALVTAACSSLFARLAERRGWVDDGSEAPLRKLQARPVAPIGGTAIVCGCAVGACAAAQVGGSNELAWLAAPGAASAAPLLAPRAWLLLALVAAFGVGLCDDRASRGLSPMPKLAGQMIAAALLALASAGRGDGGALQAESFLLWFVGGVVAQNALNTFDNADGAASALSLMGFAPVAPLIAGAMCGFLPFNLWIRTRVSSDRGAASAPRAYLGDSGSHLLGLLLFIDPQTRLALFVPVLDLARVALVRIRRGGAPWIGDRRHLAHRMQDCGWTPSAIVAALCLIALPLVGAGAVAAGRTSGGLYLAAGAASSSVLFCIALRLCPARG